VFLIDIPFYSESDNLNCAPAAARSVLAYLGIQKTEEELANLMKTKENNGTPPRNLIKGIEDLGLRAEFIHKLPVDEAFKYLKNCIERKTPVIVSLNMNVYRNDIAKIDGNPSWQGNDFTFHYVVVIGIDDESVTILDNKDKTEKEGKRTLDKESFIRAWHNDRLFGDMIIISRN
jgi:ABC-type bacteriocin/lantibiotic exporter with double-glycine peptidase domain